LLLLLSCCSAEPTRVLTSWFPNLKSQDSCGSSIKDKCSWLFLPDREVALESSRARVGWYMVLGWKDHSSKVRRLIPPYTFILIFSRIRYAEVRLVINCPVSLV